MLQQTQAERVVPHFARFLKAFPTVRSCAAAAPSDVVRQWSGLGYNRRALNLHRSAQAMVERHGGAVPDDDAALRALPGIGVYTARAVRSFGFGHEVAAVDTNGIRVLARCVQGRALSTNEAMALGDRLVPSGQVWDFNQAMFDLGATVCRSRPDCAACPMRRICRWHQGGMAEPDPWRASPSVRTQTRFDGSDRQGRGRLLDALRARPLRRREVPAACGWPDDAARAERITAALVGEGFAEWSGGRSGWLRLSE
jgi:A/G-specific adenine glycosylase